MVLALSKFNNKIAIQDINSTSWLDGKKGRFCQQQEIVWRPRTTVRLRSHLGNPRSRDSAAHAWMIAAQPRWFQWCYIHTAIAQKRYMWHFCVTCKWHLIRHLFTLVRSTIIHKVMQIAAQLWIAQVWTRLELTWKSTGTSCCWQECPLYSSKHGVLVILNGVVILRCYHLWFYPSTLWWLSLNAIWSVLYFLDWWIKNWWSQSKQLYEHLSIHPLICAVYSHIFVGVQCNSWLLKWCRPVQGTILIREQSTVCIPGNQNLVVVYIQWIYWFLWVIVFCTWRSTLHCLLNMPSTMMWIIWIMLLPKMTRQISCRIWTLRLQHNACEVACRPLHAGCVEFSFWCITLQELT